MRQHDNTSKSSFILEGVRVVQAMGGSQEGGKVLGD